MQGGGLKVKGSALGLMDEGRRAPKNIGGEIMMGEKTPCERRKYDDVFALDAACAGAAGDLAKEYADGGGKQGAVV